MRGYLRKIIPFSSVDGPGNRTAIFLQGCNFNCLYCHNPETIDIVSPDNPVDDVQFLEAGDLVEKSLEYKDFIRGITISGGECTVQIEFLIEVCKKFKERDVEVYIDTNGHLSLKSFKELSRYVDKFMFDIKAWDVHEHLKLTGVGNDKVIENFKYAMGIGKIFEVRTVIVPKILDNHQTVLEVSRLVASFEDKIRYKLIKFRNKGVVGNMKEINTPSDKYMSKLKTVALNNGIEDVVII